VKGKDEGKELEGGEGRGKVHGREGGRGRGGKKGMVGDGAAPPNKNLQLQPLVYTFHITQTLHNSADRYLL